MKSFSKLIEEVFGKALIGSAILLAGVNAKPYQTLVLLRGATIEEIKQDPERFANARDIDLFVELFNIQVANNRDARIELVRSINFENLEQFKNALGSDFAEGSGGPSCPC